MSEDISELLEKYLRNECTEAEAEIVLRWLAADDVAIDRSSIVQALLSKEAGSDEALKAALEENKQRLMSRMDTRQHHPKIGRREFRYFVAAASVVGIMGIGLYLWTGRTGESSDVAPKNLAAAKAVKGDEPGRKAILTLGDGQKIILDEEHDGQLAQQGATKVIKLNGSLSYQSGGKQQRVVYNTITTPKGGQYKVILADGTLVWLNAMSSLRFPTFFEGKTRSVELTGEGYFEVRASTAQVFTVKVNQFEVKVLGTHFNIMAYGNESTVKATLLEGKINFVSGQKKVSLSPGQQASAKTNSIRVSEDVDVAEVIAWKSGYFQFERGASIKKIMRQIERWYDVEVVYEGGLPQRSFGGKISRSSKLEDVLHIMKINRINFRTEGKKIIIRP